MNALITNQRAAIAEFDAIRAKNATDAARAEALTASGITLQAAWIIVRAENRSIG